MNFRTDLTLERTELAKESGKGIKKEFRHNDFSNTTIIDILNENGINFMLSNSDCLGKDGTDRFFDDLFIDYSIERVWASRNVNAIASKRGKLTEIVVNNYHNRYLF